MRLPPRPSPHFTTFIFLLAEIGTGFSVTSLGMPVNIQPLDANLKAIHLPPSLARSPDFFNLLPKPPPLLAALLAGLGLLPQTSPGAPEPGGPSPPYLAGSWSRTRAIEDVRPLVDLVHHLAEQSFTSAASEWICVVSRTSRILISITPRETPPHIRRSTP